MNLLPLNIPPGVTNNGTELQAAGRWYRSNLVRWSNGVLEPVGGWTEFISTQLEGTCRGIFAWRDLLGLRHAAFGTNTNLSAWSDRGPTQDITPEDFNPGREDSIYGAGYSFGPYSSGAYGTPSGAETQLLAAVSWQFANFGEDLVACAFSDGRLLRWSPGSDDPAAPIPNAPERNRGVFVTPERHVVALASDGVFNRVAWSDRENPEEWAPSSTNRAGDFDLATTGLLLTNVAVRGETLLLTSEDAHSMTFRGGEFVYGFERLGSNCGCASPQAAVAVDDFAVWMGRSGFFNWNGSVDSLPCDVEDYVYSDINLDQLAKVAAGANPVFEEVWWFYPSAQSVENDRYVVWNYRENIWYIGELSRTAWFPPGVLMSPLATTPDGQVYRHEDGWTADGAPLTSERFAEAAGLQISDTGGRLMVVKRMIPDERSQGETQMRFTLRNTPNGEAREVGPVSLSNYTDLRFTARQVGVRVEGAADAPWRAGLPRFEVTPGSRR